jgi:hypothetical protein
VLTLNNAAEFGIFGVEENFFSETAISRFLMSQAVAVPDTAASDGRAGRGSVGGRLAQGCGRTPPGLRGVGHFRKRGEQSRAAITSQWGIKRQEKLKAEAHPAWAR